MLPPTRPMPRPMGGAPTPDGLNGLGKLGMMLMATGTTLKGGNGMQFYQQYEADQEAAKRKANIQGLLDSMNLSQQKRAFLEMLPFEQASPLIWDLMNPKPVKGRAPTEAELAAQFAAGLGGAPAGGAMPSPAGGGYSMGMPDDLGAPVAASGGLSLGAPAMDSPAPATTAGLSFGNIQPTAPQAPEAPGNLYLEARAKFERTMSDPRIRAAYEAGDPRATAYVNRELSRLKALEPFAPEEVDNPIAALEARAAKAGLKEGTPEYQQFMLANGQSPKGMRFEVSPDGRVIFAEGAAAGSAGGFGDVERIDPTSTGAMVDSIQAILSDPALDNATGMLEWTQAVPGTGMYRVGTRIKQLQGQAFLQAFEALKGGGQITEVEGQKATEAIGRLDSGQSAEDYREALTELKEILIDAMERPRGWSNTTAGKIATMSARDIGKLDLKNLSEEELDIARRRLTELRKQQDQ